MNTPKRERIQKVLAAAGYGSRRACEDLVREGRVQLNGTVVDALPVLVDPQVDRLHVDHRPCRSAKRVYFLLHKPKGVVCTNRDPAGRVRAADLLRGVREQVYPVGRLDMNSTGLLLMTNDGALAERLTHPRYGIEKTYAATVAGRVGTEELQRLRQGIYLSEGKTKPAGITVVHRGRDQTQLEIKLREGRNRQIRRMLARLGHRVLNLKRTHIGRLSVRGLGPGNFRPLHSTEIRMLHKVSNAAEPGAHLESAMAGREQVRRRSRRS